MTTTVYADKETLDRRIASAKNTARMGEHTAHLADEFGNKVKGQAFGANFWRNDDLTQARMYFSCLEIKVGDEMVKCDGYWCLRKGEFLLTRIEVGACNAFTQEQIKQALKDNANRMRHLLAVKEAASAKS